MPLPETGLFFKRDYWIAQAKYDGHRCTLVKYADGRCDAVTREKDTITKALNDVPWWKRWRVDGPLKGALDGELIAPGGRGDVTRQLANARRGEPCALDFVPFGAPGLSWGSFDVLCALLGMKPALRTVMQDTHDDTLANMRERDSRGVEGFVFKPASGAYDGPWYKYKPVLTCDCVVVRLKPGCGKYTDCCGALIVGLLPDRALPAGMRPETHGYVEVACVSGMDDATRWSITSADIGRVVEVAYQIVGAKGRLTHPRFVTWRDDKRPGECGLSQVALVHMDQ
jgi:ATP-dependent DNA ligase